MKTRNIRSFFTVVAVSASLLGASSQVGLASTVVVPVQSTSPFIQWTSGAVVGIAAFLGFYDIVRRTTCSGDVLNLGGPGFSQPIRPTDNVIPPPHCPPPAGH